MEIDNQSADIISESLRLASLSGSYSPVSQQPQQQKMFGPLTENIDPKLQKRIEECKRENSTLPMTKEIMKCKILERRAQLGLGEINITFDGQKTFALTAEEEEKRQRRRDQNKKAAARCRDRRRLRDKVLSQEVNVELKKNAFLRESLRKLKAQRDNLYNQLLVHGRTCPILAPIQQIPAAAKGILKNNADFYHKDNNNGFCETFMAAKSIHTSASRLLPIVKTEDIDLGPLCSLSSDKPCMTLQSPSDITLMKADNSFVSSNALTLIGTSDEQDFPLDFISFPFPSSSSSFVSSPTCPVPSSSFPSPPSSTIPHLTPNLFLSPTTNNISPPLPPLPHSHPLPHLPVSLSSSSPSKPYILQSSLPIPTRRPRLPVHLSPLSPQNHSFSPSSSFSPPSPHSFSSSLSFSPPPSSVSSTSSLASDCTLQPFIGPAYQNDQTTYSRTDDNLLDTAALIPNTYLYNPSNDPALTNNSAKTNIHTPLITSQIEGNSLFTATEVLQLDTQLIERRDSGDNCDNLLQFPLQLSQEHPRDILMDVNNEQVSNLGELDLQMYL